MYVGLLVGLSMCAILKWRREARCDGFGSESLAIAERLAHSDPGNAGWQRDLSVSYNKIGDVLVAQGNLPEARDPGFIHGLLGQLITAGDMAGPRDDHETGFLFSVMEGVTPRDIIDAMIGSQIGMLQGLIVKQVRCVNRTNDPALRDVAVNTLGKLIRTFTALVEALRRRRNGGSPSVSVGHMSINDHGQAIVGNLTQSQGEAAPDEAAPSPPLPVGAKAVPMPSVENKEPVPLPESRARPEE
jgi:hypothetical protein